MSVSLVVSLAWNFLLQKNFVYIPSKFDKYAISIVDMLTFHKTQTDCLSDTTKADNTDSSQKSQIAK